MKNLLMAVLFLLPLSLAKASPVTQAPAPLFGVKALSDKAIQGEPMVRLVVSDTKAKAGVCRYYVRSLQYLPAVKVLSVDVYQENCVNDAFGISEGEVDWIVPATLLNDGQVVQVIVNQRAAASMSFDTGTQTFQIKN